MSDWALIGISIFGRSERIQAKIKNIKEFLYLTKKSSTKLLNKIFKNKIKTEKNKKAEMKLLIIFSALVAFLNAEVQIEKRFLSAKSFSEFRGPKIGNIVKENLPEKK